MENASNALIIVAGVLVGVLILTLGISLFTILGEVARNSHTEIEEARVQQFNEEFFKYDGRTDLTIQDVITAKNKALEINEAYDNYDTLSSNQQANENNYYIDVIFKGVSSTQTIFKSDIEELLKTYSNVKIACTEVKISETTKRVFKIVFEITP